MAIEWKKNDLPTLAQKVADDASETCQNSIYAGIDVELSDGTQHFSLMPNDQTNIDSMFAAITLGASEYPYGPSGESTMLIDANTFSTIAAGAVQVSANTVRGINVDSARKKFTLFTAKKRETEWSEKLGFTFDLEPTAPADKPQEVPDYGGMRTAELMEIPYEELEAARKKATDEVYGDDSWEKELDAKNRAKAGIDGPDAETLERDAERLKQYEEKTDLSPYELLEKAQSCMGELKEAYEP